ncbi:MAG: ABC-2 transporter permease [Firmicutes bacterium]|nr:ABC-2 transporter permease [Bacillota bacterium]
MKSLVIKDIFMLQKAFKMILVLVAFYIVIFLLTGASAALPMVMAILAVTFPISTFSYDEANKWDRYALSGPLVREDIVRAKYLLCLLLMAVALIIGFIGLTIMNFFSATVDLSLTEILLIVSISILLGLCGQAIILPIIYKLGAEKGRMFLIAVMMIPILTIILFNRFADPELKQFFSNNLHFFPFILIILVIAGYALSYKISLRIYMGKEF